jgi:hypothetical protein
VGYGPQEPLDTGGKIFDSQGTGVGAQVRTIGSGGAFAVTVMGRYGVATTSAAGTGVLGCGARR